MRCKILIGFVVCCLSLPVAALESRKLNYRIEIHFAWPLSGKIIERLRQLNEGVWQLEREGLIYGFTASEVSRFRVKGATVQSISYQKKDSGLPGTTKQEITFAPGNTSLYDPISLAIKIGADLRANPQLTKASYTFSETQGKEKNIAFTFTPGVTIETDLGPQLSVRVEQVDTSQRVYWMSTEYDYIILRALERDDKGNIKTEINIRSGTVGGKPLKPQE